MEMPPPPPPPPFGGPAAAAGGSKLDRKTVERNRRNQMNALYSRLDTLVRAGSSPSSAAAVSACSFVIAYMFVIIHACILTYH
jgi:hypothetical protein|uniref:BHLH domain-containing protein n=1 Tax=Zea mays TaxID=4577 RepID=A0A804PGX6_MAIZE